MLRGFLLEDIQIHVMIVLRIHLAQICLVHFDVFVILVTKSQVIQHVLISTNVKRLLLAIPVLSATIQSGRLHVNVTLVSVVMALISVLISMSVMKVSMNAQKHQNALTILVITAANVIMDMTVKTAQVARPRVFGSFTLFNTT